MARLAINREDTHPHLPWAPLLFNRRQNHRFLLKEHNSEGLIAKKTRISNQKSSKSRMQYEISKHQMTSVVVKKALTASQLQLTSRIRSPQIDADLTIIEMRKVLNFKSTCCRISRQSQYFSCPVCPHQLKSYVVNLSLLRITSKRYSSTMTSFKYRSHSSKE